MLKEILWELENGILKIISEGGIMKHLKKLIILFFQLLFR